MSKDEWLNKLYEWTKSDNLLGRLPYMFYIPLAEKLMQYETERDEEKQLRARITELLAVGEELAEVARPHLEFPSSLSVNELEAALIKWDAATK